MNKALIIAAEHGAAALRARAYEAEDAAQRQGLNPSVMANVAKACETDRVDADILDGWALRQREDIGWLRDGG